MDRIIEKNRTYRIPKADGTTELLQVVGMGKTLKMKDIKTGKIKSMDKANFVKKLNEGSIYVSAITKNILKKQLTEAGIKIVKGNYVRKSDIELYLLEADWKETLKQKFKPLFKNLVSGLLAAGLFFGTGVAKAEEAAKSAKQYGYDIQNVIDQNGKNLKAEAKAVKNGNFYNLVVKITNPDSKDVCAIDIMKSGGLHIDVKLKTNTSLENFDSFHAALCQEVYKSWEKKMIDDIGE